MELIDKDIILTEIDRIQNLLNLDDDGGRAVMAWSVGFRRFINTLDVVDIDLEELARHYLLHEHISPLNEVLHQADLKTEMQYHKDIEDAYKAGFMLGLKTKKEE